MPDVAKLPDLLRRKINYATARAFRFLRQPRKLLMLFPLPPARVAGVQLPKLRWCPSAVLPFHRPRFSLLPSRLQPHMTRAQRGP